MNHSYNDSSPYGAAAPFDDACSHPDYAFTKAQRIALFVTGVPQVVLTILMNIVILGIFFRTKGLLSPQYYYFINLAACDLITGLVAIPSRLTLDLRGCWPTPFAFCRLFKVLDWTVPSEANTTMILIALDRYRMICRGANFSTEETSTRVLRKIVASWILNVILYVPANFVDLYTGIRLSGNSECKNEFFQISWLGNLLVFTDNVIPPVLVLSIYVAVFFALRSRESKIKPSLMPQLSYQSSLTDDAGTGTPKKTSKTPKQSTTILLLTATFFATTCPCGIVSIVMFACNCDSVVLFRIYLWTLYLLYSNSFFNTIVYATKIPGIRSGLSKAFKSFRRSGSRIENSSASIKRATAMEDLSLQKRSQAPLRAMSSHQESGSGSTPLRRADGFSFNNQEQK